MLKLEDPDKIKSQIRISLKAEVLLPASFELLELIGQGGHGEVYKATNKMLERIVAVKVISSDGSADMERQLERMRREAKLLARLSHENIVRVFQFGVCDDGRPFLVCEYLEGITLDRLLAEQKVLDKEQILLVFSQILDALQYTHEKGILHRDLKPSNIMLLKESNSGKYQVKLLDFGIARDFEKTADSAGLTQTTLLSGSPSYMSPEQCQGLPLDMRSDLYSLACVLHECLFGHPPFLADSAIAVQYLQIHESAEKLESLRSLESGLADLFIRALSKDPSRRPVSAVAFRSELVRALKAKDKRTDPSRIIIAALACLLLLLLASFAVAPALRKKVLPVTLRAVVAPPKARTLTGIAGTISAAVQIEKIAKNLVNQEILTDADRQASINLLDKISAKNKDDKEVYFAACYLSARILEEIPASREESIRYLDKAMQGCRQFGRETSEEAHCYYLYGRLEKDLEKQRELLEKSLRIYDDQRTGNPIVLLTESSLSSVLPRIIGADIHYELAENAERRKDYKNALRNFELSAKIRSGEIDEKTFSNSVLGKVGGRILAWAPTLKSADMLIKLGRSRAAFDYVSAYTKQVSAQDTSKQASDFYKQTALFEIAKWCYQHNKSDSALKVLKLSNSAAGQHVATDQRMRIESARLLRQSEEAAAELESNKRVSQWSHE